MIGVVLFLLALVGAGTLLGAGVEVTSFISAPTWYLALLVMGIVILAIDAVLGMLSSVTEHIGGAVEGTIDAIGDYFHFDIGDGTGEAFSFKGMFSWTLGVFLMGYGGLGLVLSSAWYGRPISVALMASALPLLFSVLMFKFVFSRFGETTTVMNTASMIGRTATVSIPITKGNFGQIMGEDKGTGTFTGRAVIDSECDSKAILAGTTVLITAVEAGVYTVTDNWTMDFDYS